MNRFTKHQPSKMSMDAFISVFGPVYEHSSWIAQVAYEQGLNAEDDFVDHLLKRMRRVLAGADKKQQLALINAHPDLAGKAALAKNLTASSNAEQASAGINNCTPQEFERFTQLNTAYKKKFEFPFIMAVKGSNKDAILAAFEQRILNDYQVEFERALLEINKIALIRLSEL